MASYDSPIILQTGQNPQQSIIWLHGLGADGHDFVPIVEELELSIPVRYIFPHAPMRPVTINGGFVMRAWYDITHAASAGGLEIGSDSHQDADGIRASQAAIEALIAQEVAKGISPRNIFLAGFSQGGVIALHTALRHATPLGGVLALSTYLPLAERTPGELLVQTKATPIFMVHGRSDQVIPYTLGVASRDALLKLGYAVEWHEYAMQHSVCEDELKDIGAWLRFQIQKPGF
jgi:phospholipase/carboxylesterase